MVDGTAQSDAQPLRPRRGIVEPEDVVPARAEAPVPPPVAPVPPEPVVPLTPAPYQPQWPASLAAPSVPSYYQPPSATDSPAFRLPTVEWPSAIPSTPTSPVGPVPPVVPVTQPAPVPVPIASSSWEAALADIAARAGVDHKFVESAIAATLGTTPKPAEPTWPAVAPEVPATVDWPPAPQPTTIPPLAAMPDVPAPVVPVTPPALWTQPPDDLMAGVSTVYSAPGLGLASPAPQPPAPQPPEPEATETASLPPLIAQPTPQLDLPDLPRPATGAVSAVSPVISIGVPTDDAATVQFERPSIDKPAPPLPVSKPVTVDKPELSSDAADDFFGPVPAELAKLEDDDKATVASSDEVAEPGKADKQRTKRLGRSKAKAKDDAENADKPKAVVQADAEDKGSETGDDDAETDESKTKTKTRRLSRLPGPAQWAIEIAVWVVAALILSTLIRLFVVQLFVVPSGSMENTLMTSDRIAALKYAQFQRGDIVVFSDPGGWLAGEPVPQISSVHRFFEKIGLLASTDQQYLVKRVIGLPGDRVQCCSNGHLTVNGVPIDESSYLKDPTAPASAFLFDVTVPAGRIFVLGDNRNSSADSRWHLCEANDAGLGMNGFVPISDVVGPVRAVVLPFGRTGHRATPTSVFAQVPAATDPPPTVAKVSVSAGGPNGACHS